MSAPHVCIHCGEPLTEPGADACATACDDRQERQRAAAEEQPVFLITKRGQAVAAFRDRDLALAFAKGPSAPGIAPEPLDVSEVQPEIAAAILGAKRGGPNR